MEEVVTPHSGEAKGEMRLEQVGARLVHNFSGMNESRDSRSSIRKVPARNIPFRTGSGKSAFPAPGFPKDSNYFSLGYVRST